MRSSHSPASSYSFGNGCVNNPTNLVAKSRTEYLRNGLLARGGPPRRKICSSFAAVSRYGCLIHDTYPASTARTPHSHTGGDMGYRSHFTERLIGRGLRVTVLYDLSTWRE